MSITAKYPGTCKACGKPFAAGTQIEWQKGEGSRHLNCNGAAAAAPAAAPRKPGQASDKQIAYLRKLIRRVERISQFDSFSGSGVQVADETEERIHKLGGWDALTSRQASELIDSLAQAADDEM